MIFIENVDGREQLPSLLKEALSAVRCGIRSPIFSVDFYRVRTLFVDKSGVVDLVQIRCSVNIFIFLFYNVPMWIRLLRQAPFDDIAFGVSLNRLVDLRRAVQPLHFPYITAWR